MNITRTLVAAAFALSLLASAQNSPDPGTKRYQDIRARYDKGQAISDEDRRFAQHYMAKHQEQLNAQKAVDRQALAQRDKGFRKAHPPRESTGLVPLPDLGKGTYQGEQGGLYPGGENRPPPAHLKAGLALAARIVPVDGKIVLLSIGFSNATQEFQTFQKLAAQEKGLNPRLAIVDGAQGRQTADMWSDPGAGCWQVLGTRLEKAGVAAKQVQAVWLKLANHQPEQPFPAEVKKLQGQIVATLHNLHERLPNLKIVYLSSRIYAGYATNPLNPEPHSYESGFSVKWTIAEQINGNPELNYDPAKGTVRAPWLAWGPYLWTDGVKGRKTDGLTWVKDDVIQSDRTHPSDSGREKVARLLMDFLKNDPTSRPWFLTRSDL